MIYNRIGDAGFLVALFLIFERTGSLQYTTVFSRLGHVSTGEPGRHRPAAVPRRGRKVRAVTAVPVACRRDGRSDAGLRAHPRGDDGHGRGLPDVPDQPDPASRSRRRAHGRVGWRRTAFVGGDGRLRADRHQEGPRVLDGLPARLHVPRRRDVARTSRRSS